MSTITTHIRQSTHTGGSSAPVLDDGRIAELASRIRCAGDLAPIEVHAPFTGALLARLPRCSPADVRAAVARARAAQREWASTSHAGRRRIFLRFHDLVLQRQEEGLDLIQLEAGKARRHALEEVLDTAVVARHYAVRAGRYLRPRRRRGALPLLTAAYEYRHPVGVVGCIVPWNYPLNLAMTDATAALLAGNAVVLKPDHQTTLTALWAVALLHEAGLPDGVLELVAGEGPALGPALLDEVDFVMFTGSTATGRVIGEHAARRLIGCSLELGGKNPMIVLPDADLDRTVEGALRGCFAGAGQVCVAMERIYLPEALFEPFAERFAARAGQLRLGTSLDYLPEMGSLSSERQLRTVVEHVEDALARGARLLCGGRPRPDVGPYFYEPTVLADVTPEMRVHAEETFGPVVALYRYSSVDEAIRLANATSYGLNASVWGRNLKRARGVARRIETGTVNVNETYAASWGSVDAPIGGRKESGLGRRHGAEGLLKYTEPQTVAVQRLGATTGPWGMSHATYARVISAFLRLMRHVPGLR